MFFEANQYEGATDYDAAVPENYRSLLVEGFRHQYVTGRWGAYLSLDLDTEDFSFGVHHFFRRTKGVMFVKPASAIHALFYTLRGQMTLLNQEYSLELDARRSHFLSFPEKVSQAFVIEKGSVTSVHINFKRSYLQKSIHHYRVLKNVLNKHDNYSNRCFRATSVIRDHIIEYSWRQLLETILHVPNPVLYLDVHARDLMRIHDEKLERDVVLGEVGSFAGFSNEQIKAAREVARIMEMDISDPHRIDDLARKVGLNRYDLKRAFKAVFKITIHQYLLRLRMNFAKDQVLSSTRSNREIAKLSGIKNASHFCQVFKKTFGASPGLLRRY